MFFFSQEMAKKLKEIRIKANLSQTEVGIRIGLKPKNAPKYISNLEAGKINNPTLRTILNYIRACGASWVEFFKELDRIDFKMRHEKMISQLPPPASQRKIQRDAMRYEIGVEFPSKDKEEIDFTRLKKQIKDKVERLVIKEEITLTPTLSHQGRGKDAVNATYQKFAMEFFDFQATLNKAGMKMVLDKYLRAGLQFNLISKIKKIINSVIYGEIKRIEAKKPLPTEKQERMAIGFTRYRIKMERIESEVHRLLCELGVQSGSGKFSLYKDFARECYGILKRYYGKEPLAEKLQPVIKRWVKEGLEEDVLLKVRDATIKVFAGKNI
jgi:transcriptional regulator with XRE-family HTH domain